VGPGVDYAVLNGWHHRETTRLARLLRKRQPDVVIAIGAISNLKLVLAHRLVRPKTRIVLSYHGHSNVGRGRLGALAYWFAPALTRAADATVCVSDDLIRHLADDWRVPPERLTRIHNPVAIDKARPARTEAELRARPPLVLGMARLWPEKGFDTLIAAMGLLPDPAIRLVIYGEGPERKRLEALVGRLGLADRVSLPGYVPDPWQAYAEARCFALASNDEAFGNVVVEALASGLPVVATKSGGPEEILDHGRCGALVPPRDPAAMAAAIVRALRDPGDPGPRIERARAFDARAVATRYVALFEEVLTRA
jgi:glycosyltransferase involved in cell wall biosynthesis